MCSPGHVSVFQWNCECLFFRHVVLNTRFNMTTINVVFFDRPKIVAGFCAMFCFVYWLRLVRTSLKISTEFFVWNRLVPQKSRFWDSMISSRQCYCAICDREDKTCSPCFVVITSFALSLRAWLPDASKIFSSSMSANKMSPFQIPPANNTCPRNIPGKTFLPHWSFAEIGWYTTIAPNEVTGLSHGSPIRVSWGVLPSARKSWTFHR